MRNVLAELTREEHALLTDAGGNLKMFGALTAFLRRGTLASNVVRGRVKPPRPAQITWPRTRVSPRTERSGVGMKAVRSGRVGVILLNGGMATRFGGQVKGVVDALPGCSFLQLKAEGLTAHLRDGDPQPPLLIMNSSHTDAATRQHLDQHDWFGLQRERTRMFMQSALPHLRPDGTLYRSAAAELSLYSPGHGDLFASLARAGAIDWLRSMGVEWVLVSNVDNLGATLNPIIVSHCVRSRREMVVEVAVKDPDDVGGAPVNVDGHLRVVEDFALPPGFDRSTLPVFNTNTLWFTPDGLEQPKNLHWYLTRKRLPNGDEVVQFERLVGQASWFLNTGYIGVDRATRFLPVKTPEDLQRLQPTLAELFGRNAA